LSHNRSAVGPFSGGGDPERAANIAFLLGNIVRESLRRS